MAKIHRECREKSLPAIRLSRPLDFFSDISDWTTSKRYYVKNRDIVRENIRQVKSSLPRLPAVRKVPPFCPQSYQPNTSVVPLPMIAPSRSKSVDSNVSDDCNQFRSLFSRGDLHVRIVHAGGPGEKPRELRWAKDPSQMKPETICTLLGKFSTGMSLLDHPYRFVAETGITDLLIALRNHHILVSVLPQLVRGIRAGLYSFDTEKKKFCLKTLSRITSMQTIGPQLVPFYRQLLPPLRSVRQSRSRSDRVHYDKGRQIEEIITSTLNDLERTGGPNALINIKYLLPHYESFLFELNAIQPEIQIIREFLPLVRQCAPSRIILVSSIVHSQSGVSPEMPLAQKIKVLCPQTPEDATWFRLYARSKMCNMLTAFKLHRDEVLNEVSTYSVHPGNGVRTNIFRDSWLVRIASVLSTPFTKNISQGAATTVYCAAHPEVALVSGRYWDSCWDDEKGLYGDVVRDVQLQDALWEHSNELVNSILDKERSEQNGKEQEERKSCVFEC